MFFTPGNYPNTSDYKATKSERLAQYLCKLHRCQVHEARFAFADGSFIKRSGKGAESAKRQSVNRQGSIGLQTDWNEVGKTQEKRGKKQ